MQQQFVRGGEEAKGGITIQLTASYLLAGAVELLLLHWLGTFSLAPAITIILALTCSVGIGSLATANIKYRLFMLYLALTRLADGETVELTPTFWHWPLRHLFRSLSDLSQREESAHRYHQQLLQQASEAAAVEERNRLARELHDSIKQQLFSIRMSAIAANAHVQGSQDQIKTQRAIEDIQNSANEAQVEMQALLQQLRSVALEHTTLTEAVHTQAMALEYRSGAQVAVDIAELPAIDRCPLSMQEAIFRIIQEGLANIARHARAKQVLCTIESDEDNLFVMIHDDGQGFDLQKAKKGMGLVNIQERAQHLHGTARIESAVGKGTTIQVQVPLLLSPEARQLNEQQEFVVQRAIERVHGGLQIRSTIAIFAMVLLAADQVMFAANTNYQAQKLCGLLLIVCFSLMFYGLISAHLAIIRAQLYYGKEDKRMQSFHFHEHLGWIGFLRLLMIVSWHVVFWGLTLLVGAHWWQIGISLLVMMVLFLALYLYEYQQFQQAQDRFYGSLSMHALNAEIKQRWASVRWRIIICLCLGAPLLLQNTLASALGSSFWRWLAYYILFILFTLCLGVAIDLRQIRHWRQGTMARK